MEGFELDMLKAVSDNFFKKIDLILMEVNRKAFWEGISVKMK